MDICKKIAPAFLLLAQLVVLMCHSGKLCAASHHTGNYYHVTDTKSGKELYFYSDIPVNTDLFQRNGELQIGTFLPEPPSSLESSLEVYRFSGGLNFNINSRRRPNPEAFSQEYTISITPVIRTLLARSAHERFSQFSTPPSRIQSGRDTHVVTIYVVLPGSSRVSTFMDDLATVADTLVDKNAANSWQPGEITFSVPNRPVLSLAFSIDNPHAPSPATLVEPVQPVVRNRATRSGNSIMGVIMRSTYRLQSDLEQVSSESPAFENRRQRAYCRQTRELSPHGQLQFNVAMSADLASSKGPEDSEGSEGSAERVEQIIRAFREHAQFTVLEPAELAVSPSDEAVARASSQGENHQASYGAPRVGYTESFYSDGVEQQRASDIVHFYSPRENPPVDWFVDDLHALRQQVVQRLDRERVLNGGSQEYLIREATGTGSSQRHFRIAMELPLSALKLDSEQVPVSVNEEVMLGLLENIQGFLRILELDQHITFSWHFHDVNFTGSRLEVTFFLTNYIRARDSVSGRTNIGIRRLNRISPDYWQVREWTPLYISTFTPEPVATRAPRISLLDGVMLRALHGLSTMRQWFRRSPRRHSEQHQEPPVPDVQEQRQEQAGSDVQEQRQEPTLTDVQEQHQEPTLTDVQEQHQEPTLTDVQEQRQEPMLPDVQEQLGGLAGAGAQSTKL